ncbi:MAG: hypothetical protein U9R43_18290, partial [Thermodesulfobacteriota bacterium]|nr:hypothetical protein [Thermodesulfobacteriota bacterium]
MMKISFSFFNKALLLLPVVILSSLAYSQQDVKTKPKKEKKYMFVDSTERSLDISSFLDHPYGFVPIPIIVTEPAVGYGGGLALLFIQQKKKKDKGRSDMPMITGVAGAYTQNKTWVAGLYHFQTWNHDKIRYTGILAKTNVNIKYYGTEDGLLSRLWGRPVRYNMNAWLIKQRLQFRVAESDFFMGFQYLFYRTENSLDTLSERPLINKLLKKMSNTSVVSTVTMINSYDTRNNIFTPTRGIYAGWNISYNP